MVSVALTIFCIAIIIYGISYNHAALSGSPVMHMFILIFSVTLLGYLEVIIKFIFFYNLYKSTVPYIFNYNIFNFLKIIKNYNF